MNALISNPADCEVRGVIRFLQAENFRSCEIHQRLVAVYGEHVMNAASVRKWYLTHSITRRTSGRNLEAFTQSAHSDIEERARGGRGWNWPLNFFHFVSFINQKVKKRYPHT